MTGDFFDHITADADRLTGLPHIAEFFETDSTDQQVANLRGSLWVASIILVDHLFDDLKLFEEDGVDSCWVLSDFPRRFRHHFTVNFIRRLIVAAGHLTTQFARGWRGPACVAEELLFGAILDQVETYEDDGFDLPPDWRGVLESFLLGDTDYKVLFRMELDGIEDGAFPALGMAPMDFECWFVPFTGFALPPYIADTETDP
jgi:hypothetical protein